jgi:hypothetical protein
LKTLGQKRPCKGFHFGQLRIYNAAGYFLSNTTAKQKGSRANTVRFPTFSSQAYLTPALR